MPVMLTSVFTCFLTFLFLMKQMLRRLKKWNVIVVVSLLETASLFLCGSGKVVVVVNSGGKFSLT